ncbi:beta-glucosidase BglX [Flavobacterium hiemivividum]|uniref:beta-glucosidase n=1 Tax=Flavobacterium hiemivividum TaxID=2541734 RepID=A0A4R5CY62_9FLAO|nr:beta-glucosidase BglX [Flavobacterium hiemivividum]TDE04051.1 beta-glucosidase BglX [Flavobacterium hiemivividum]
MRNIKIVSLVISTVVILSCSQKIIQPKVVFSKKDILENRVDSVMKLMTLEEKIGQLNQYNGFWEITGPTPKEGQAAKKYADLKNGLVGSMLNVKGVKDVRALQKIAVEETRLGIPLIFGFDVIHGYKTISPIPLAEAASWDLVEIKRSAAVAAEEAASVGLNWTFAPMVDISRDARWGRVMEGSGEDPYLGSQIAVARVQGFQGDNLNAKNTILATAKHFAGYGFSESGRDYNTVDVGESTLQNIIFPPFKAAVDAGVRTFMNSFNELNGIPATGNKYLQRDILKEDWKFDGFVVSDWGSINEMMAHGYAKDSKQAAEIAINAGSDMDMESYAYVEYLSALVKEGKVKESVIDDAARRILRVKFELGLFDNPYLYCDENYEKETVGKPAFQEAVLEMAKKSIVLLKNEKELLPLKKSGQKIVVIGALANDKTSPLGSWRIAADDESAVSLLEGMQKYKGNNLTYIKGADVAVGRTQFVWETKINMTDKSGFAEAIKAAKGADVVVMSLGEHGLQSGEGRSRTDLGLAGVQQELLEEVYKVNPNVVLVLNNGRPLAIPWADENIPAIVEAWHLGTQSGNAIAQVLYGDYNPSGKLPMTFPRSVGQVPIYYNYKNTGRPVMTEPDSVFWSHYIDEENTPLYPFGYGLSYSKFEYSNIELSQKSFADNGQIEVSVLLKNTGKYSGKEVVQLYIRDLFASVTRPVLELKGFEMIELQPNETKKVSFVINKKTIEFFSANSKWEAEAGDFKVFVGGSSTKTLEADFQYKKN